MTTDHLEASVADPTTFTVRRTITIAAPIETVWQAVTEPEHISRWFGRADFASTSAGSLGTLTWDGYGSVPIRIESVDAPRSITYRWANDDALGTPPTEVTPGNSTVFTFDLVPIDGGTQLTVVETGFEQTSAPLVNLEEHRKGWDGELDKLIALLGGRP
ncbi:MAG: SRPBCC domain-containing protein [Candidatus Nanopelagicales bacterium]